MSSGQRIEGIRGAYPHLPLSVKMRGYIQLTRPFTLLAPLIGGITVPLVYLGHAGQLPDLWTVWPTIVHGAITLLLCNLASNIYNQAADEDIDRVNKPYRPIPKGVVTGEEARSLAMVVYLFAMMRAIMISTWFGVFTFLILVLTVAYSGEPARLKKRLWISNLSIAFTRGLLGYVAAWCILSTPFYPLPWVIGLILSIYLVGATTSKDLVDMEGDRKYGMDTLPVHYGVRKSIIYSTIFLVMSGIVFAMCILFGLIRQNIYSTMLVAGGIVWMLYIIYLMMKLYNVEDELVENTRGWKNMYLLLFTLQVGFTVTYLF